MDSTFEFELWIAQYKYLVKKGGAERPLTDKELEVLDANIKNMPKEYEEAYNKAVRGNYDSFEQLPLLLRNYLGAKQMIALREQFGNDPSPEREEVRAYLEKNAMNAALRAGISAEKNSDSTKKTAAALDTYMNKLLMKRTMLPPTSDARGRLSEQMGGDEQAEAALERNKARQLVMAKTMLLAQLGKYDVVNKNGLAGDLEVPVYETLVHGNRTSFVLPSGENSQGVIDAFMGVGGGGAAGIEKRTAATHSVKLRSFGKNGIVKSESKELRTYSPLKIFGHQFGMNIAAGGIGETGPDGQKAILGDGEEGHMYMRAEAGDRKHCGSLLIGIEGSEPGKDNYLGNTHGISAKSAKQSAFLADKSIVGKKIGGRQIDLSGISSEELSSLLNSFAEKYSALQQSAITDDGREKLAEINDLLMGKRMDTSEMMDMFSSLGMTDEGLESIVANARGGYLSKVSANEISRNELAQSVRSNLSQEQACDIAAARFEYACGDLQLAVGAIKELIYTHETRGRGWKLRHPIKNYREKAMISSLAKKLETGRGFSREEIANAFKSGDDSFTMDWGKELSYDKALTRFYKENATVFRASDNKLSDAIKAFSKDRGYNKVAASAPPVVESELNAEQSRESVVSDRETISIEEENECLKIANNAVSKEIIPENKVLNNQKNF